MIVLCGVCGTKVHAAPGDYPAPWHRSCKPPCRVCGRPVHSWWVRGVDIHNACDLPSRRLF